MPQPSPFVCAFLEKRSAYSSSQVAQMYDAGGLEDSYKTVGTALGGVVGGALGLRSGLMSAQPGDTASQAALGAGVGAVGGRLAGSLAAGLGKRINQRYAVAEEMTGIPRSKLEELPVMSRLNLLGHADKELGRRRREKTADVSPTYCAACDKDALECKCPPATGSCPACGGKMAAGNPEFSAAQLREYQLKRVEPRMAALINMAGAGAGGVAGAALGEQVGHPYIGAALGSLGGAAAAIKARELASKAIANRYLTRRVIEQASASPISTQVRALRGEDSPSVVTGVESLVTKVPPSSALRVTVDPSVEGLKIAGMFGDASLGGGGLAAALFRGGDKATRDHGVMSARDAKGQGHPEWAGASSFEMLDPKGVTPKFPAPAAKPTAQALNMAPPKSSFTGV